jgi:hypothetical protein
MERDFIRFSNPPVKQQFNTAKAKLTPAPSYHQLLIADTGGSTAKPRETTEGGR